MSPATSWTENSGSAASYFEGGSATAIGDATILFGIVMPIVDGIGFAGAGASWTELSGSLASYVENSGTAPTWTENNLT